MTAPSLLAHRSRVIEPRLIGLIAAALCAACSDAPTKAVPRDSVVVALPMVTAEPLELAIATYDGSGQTVHPDIVEFPQPWHGSQKWFSITPYPFGDRTLENPSIYASDRDDSLTVPSGLTNPVVPGFGADPLAYNSDPDLIYDGPTDRLALTYRVVKDGFNAIYVKTSLDGRVWTPPRLMFREPDHSAVSPTVVRETAWLPHLVWYVDAGAAGCSTTSSRVMMRRAKKRGTTLDSTSWSAAILTNLAQPGFVIWHMKVKYVATKREYWALYAAFPADAAGCANDDLFFARSTDGVHWQTYPEPLLHHQDRPWTAIALYRSTFLYDAPKDELRVWISANGGDGKWRLGFGRFGYTQTLARLATPVPVEAEARRLLVRHHWTEAP